MLRLTEGAAAHLERLRRSRELPDDVVPKFERQNGRLRLLFARGPSSGDQLVNDGHMAVLVAPSAKDLLGTVTIEVRNSAGKLRLAVKRGRDGTSASSDGSGTASDRASAGPSRT